MPIYLDNNSTTRPADEVIAAVHRALREYWSNPSSIHRPGQEVRAQVELAREEVARLLGCRGAEIAFTSGGTESVNLAICGSLAATADGGRSALVTSRLEHNSVRETAEHLAESGIEIIWLEHDDAGCISLDHLRDVLARRGDEIALVSVMWANNETGVIQPTAQIGGICREFGVLFHTDAVQYAGKMPVDLAGQPIDLLSFSAHKFHGPKGAGGLYVRRGVKIQPQITGGPQERETRGGTENAPGILGMGEAARLARAWLATDARDSLAALRDRFERAIRSAIPHARINSAAAERLWNTSNIAFPGVEGEAMLLMLSERGLCASAGAACSSGSLEPSPVLLAMGMSEDRAAGSIRFSLSRETTDDEINRAVEMIREVFSALQGPRRGIRGLSPGAAP